MPSVLFIGDHLCFPSYNGTGRVYRGWLDALQNSRFRTYALFFERFIPWPDQAKKEASERLEKFTTIEAGDITKTRKKAWHFIDLWQPDIILISKEHLCQILGITNLSRSRCLKVLDLHDDFEARRQKEKITIGTLQSDMQALFLQISNKRLLESGSDIGSELRARIFDVVDAILVANPEEASAIIERHPRLEDKIFPVRWNLHTKDSSIAPAGIFNKNEFRIGFCGSQELFNFDALRFLFDEIISFLPDKATQYRFMIAGSLCELITPTAISETHSRNIELRGMMDDLSEFYNMSNCIVVPLRFGTGVSIKTLEAMSEGKAVVCTTIGARGIPLQDKFNGFVSDDPAVLAAAIESCCNDPPLSREVGFMGRELVRWQFGPSNAVADLEHSLSSVRGGRLHLKI